MHHYRKTLKQYSAFNAKDATIAACGLCREGSGERIIRQNDTMFVIPNRVSYDMFEGRRVKDHLMVIPKRHVETLADFTDQEKIDQMTIASAYEAQGYNVYARGVGSISRSVKHQHTHLIKLVDKKPRFIVFSEKPHILIDK